MDAVIDEHEGLDVLRNKAERVRQLVAPAHERTAAVAQAAAERASWYASLEDSVLDLSNALPRGTEDYDARKLFEFLVGLRRAIDADPTAADAQGEVELATLKMRDVVRRIARRLEHDDLDDPRNAVDSILATLSGVPVGDLARMLGVSTKTVGAWRAGRPVTRNVPRIVVLAQLLTYLRASMTPTGLVMWFDAPREQIGGRTPLALLDEGGAPAREALVSLARGARGQLAD